MTIIIVRHGRTDLNDAYCWQGRIDVPLNDIGLAHARQAGEFLKDDNIGKIY